MDPQHIIDEVVNAVAASDVVYLLYWLNQLSQCPAASLNTPHSVTGLNALQTANQDSRSGRVASLMVDILLARGASPLYGGSTTCAYVLALKNQNSEALMQFENWAASRSGPGPSLAAELLALDPWQAEARLQREGLDAVAAPDENAPSAVTNDAFTSLNDGQVSGVVKDEPETPELTSVSATFAPVVHDRAAVSPPPTRRDAAAPWPTTRSSTPERHYGSIRGCVSSASTHPDSSATPGRRGQSPRLSDGDLDSSLSMRRRSAPPSPRSCSPSSARSRRGIVADSPSTGRTTDRQPTPGKWHPLDAVFLTGMPPSLAERQLYRIASRLGRVGDVFVMPGKKTDNRRERSAILQMTTESGHRLAIREFNNLVYDGYHIKARESPTGFIRDPVFPAYELKNTRPAPGNTSPELVVLHLLPDATLQDVERLFLTANLEILAARFFRRKPVRKAQTCIVRMTTGEECVRAIEELDGQLCGGEAVRVNWYIGQTSGL